MNIKKGLCKCIDTYREDEGFILNEYYYYELIDGDLIVCNNKGKLIMTENKYQKLFKLDVKVGE